MPRHRTSDMLQSSTSSGGSTILLGMEVEVEFTHSREGISTVCVFMDWHHHFLKPNRRDLVLEAQAHVATETLRCFYPEFLARTQIALVILGPRPGHLLCAFLKASNEFEGGWDKKEVWRCPRVVVLLVVIIHKCRWVEVGALIEELVFKSW
jgi:hypothetical protein